MTSRSVHLEKLPDEAEIPYYPELMEQIEVVRGICNAVLSIRSENNIKVKTPLTKLTIYSDSNLGISEFVPVILEEVNVQSISFSGDAASVGTKKVVLNLKRCGAKMGSRTKDVMQKVNEGQWQILNSGQLLVGSLKLEPEDFIVRFDLNVNNSGPVKYAQVSLGIFSKVQDQIFVSLDTSINQELQELSCVREIVRYVQQSRKKQNLSLGTVVNVHLQTNSDRIRKIIENPANRAYISSNTLSTLSVLQITGGTEGGANCQTYEIEGFGEISILIV